MSDLFKKIPIAKEMWASHKNPDDFDADSNETLRWKCKCGKRFERPINKLAEDHECSACKKEKARLTNNPELLKLWDYEKNDIDPHDVSIKSDLSYYFKCENGHSKLRKMRSVVKNPECPVCKMDTVAKNPELLKFWDFEANAGIDVETTSSNSPDKVWWKCPNCGYRWPAEIASRKASKNHCPCREEKTVVMPGFNDFFTVYPELKDDFNDNYDPSNEGVSSNKPTKWKCHLCGHEWDTYLSSRVVNGRITQCPACAGRKRTKSYAEQYPELAECYSPNNAVPLSEIVSSRDVRESYLWICPTHGEFNQTIEAMIRGLNSLAKGCPYCAGKKVKYEDSFGYLHPELVEEYSDSNTVDIFNVTAKSGIEAKWKCKNCGHEWPATFYTRHEGFGRCPKCYPNSRYKCMLYEERPDLERHYRGKRDFKTYSFQSNVEVPWECDEGHNFDFPIFRMVKDHDEFYCPVCAETRLVVGVNDFASNYPELAKEWSPSNERKPEEYFKSSVLRVKWICPNCTHEYEASLDEKVNGYSCPVCDGRLTVVGKNDLATTHPKLAKEYSSSNSVDLSKIRKELKMSVWWTCSKCGGDYRYPINEREEDDSTCPFCSGKKVLAGFNDLKTLKPTLYDRVAKSYKEVYPVIPYKPESSLLWVCPTCHGEYTDTVENIENGINNCPYCTGDKLMVGFNDLKTLHPELESEWSTSNPPMETILLKYVKPFKWICPICGGEYSATIQEQLNGEDKCLYCAGRKVLEGFNDLKTLRPELYEKVSKSYKEAFPIFRYKRENYVLWECPDCHFDYSDKIGNVEDGKSVCPVCSNRKAVPGHNDLTTTHPDIAKEWAIENYITKSKGPEKYTFKNTKSVWWKCPKCDDNYKMPIDDKVIAAKRGHETCPRCKGKLMNRIKYVPLK